MRRYKRILSLLLVIITLIACLPTPAYASYSIKALKYNQWYRINRSSSNMIIYRMKVPEDSLITIEWKGFTNANDIGGAIYRDKDCFEEIECFLYENCSSTGKKRIVLYSGTYYIGMLEKGKSNNITKVKVTKQSVKSINRNKNNTTRQKAVSLKQNKIIEFAITKRDNKQRWYKIKPNSSKISIFATSSFLYRIYDKDLNNITPSSYSFSFSLSSPSEYTQMKPAIRFKNETYYLVINSTDEEEISETGEYIKFYWKTNRLF